MRAFAKWYVTSTIPPLCFYSYPVVLAQCLLYLVDLRTQYPSLPLRAYTLPLLNLLEDSDGSIRDQAKDAVVRLFADPAVSDGARTQLKTQLSAPKNGVRKTTVDAILSRLASSQSHAASTTALRDDVDSVGTSQGQTSQSHLLIDGDASTNPLNRQSSSASVLTTATSTEESVYIASVKDLDMEFSKMHAAFEGKETEHNWQARERHVQRIRG